MWEESKSKTKSKKKELVEMESEQHFDTLRVKSDVTFEYDGMVRVAALGRSLGVHVVLATQRPAGVVTADIKANVNLRIALRVRDRSDSDDVIDAPDAVVDWKIGALQGFPGGATQQTR